MRRGTQQPVPARRVRPTTSLSNLGRQAHGSGKHLTDCKVCGAGIYVGQAYRWLTDPMGMSHTDCAPKEEA